MFISWDDGLIWKILSFNVGVELGQIIALSIMLIFLVQWRKKELFKKFSVVSNIGLILVGIALFIFQITGYFNNKETIVKPSSQVHSHDGGAMHIDQIMEPAKIKQQMHSHGGGTMHVDPEVKPIKKEPVKDENHGHTH